MCTINTRPDFVSRLLLKGLRWPSQFKYFKRTYLSKQKADRIKYIHPSSTAYGLAIDLKALRRFMNRPVVPLWLSPWPLRRVRNISIPNGENIMSARLYVPYGKVHGVLLFFHGGGFVHGGLDAYHGICCRLARQSGAAVLSIDYRLAPENPFPAAVEDAKVAYKWLEEKLKPYKDENIIVAGDSAGGTLAAVLAAEERLRPASRLVGQLLFYPSLSGVYALPSRFTYSHGYMLSQKLLEWYGLHYIDEAEHLFDPEFAPLLQSSFDKTVPSIIIAAQFDPLHDESRYYAAALYKAGVKVWYRCYGGTLHGFLNFYAFMPKAKKAIKYGAGLAKKLLISERKNTNSQGTIT